MITHTARASSQGFVMPKLGGGFEARGAWDVGVFQPGRCPHLASSGLRVEGWGFGFRAPDFYEARSLCGPGPRHMGSSLQWVLFWIPQLRQGYSTDFKKYENSTQILGTSHIPWLNTQFTFDMLATCSMFCQFGRNPAFRNGLYVLHSPQFSRRSDLARRICLRLMLCICPVFLAYFT